MGYYNYHGTAKRLIAEGKLVSWHYAARHNRIAPALVLVFDDAAHPRMPIREYRWAEYLPLLPEDKRAADVGDQKKSLREMIGRTRLRGMIE